jgi:hypothetical protein
LSTHENNQGHDRSPSNTDTVDIREVLHEYAFQENSYDLHYFMPPHIYSTASIVHAEHFCQPHGHHHQMITTGHSHSESRNSVFNEYQNLHMGNVYYPDTIQQVFIGNRPQIFHTQYSFTGEATDCDECFFIKGMTSLFRKLFGLETRRDKLTETCLKREYILQRTPDDLNQYNQREGQFQAPSRQRTRSCVLSDGSIETVQSEQVEECESKHLTPDDLNQLIQREGQFQAPSRQRTRSRVFSDGSIETVQSEQVEECDDKQFILYVDPDARTDDKPTDLFSVMHDHTVCCDKDLLTHNENKILLNEELVNWKAGGVSNHQSSYSSIVDQFNVERPFYNKTEYIKKLNDDSARFENICTGTKKSTSNRTDKERRIMKERNSKEEDPMDKPRLVKLSNRSKTEGTIGTRYSSIQSIRTAKSDNDTGCSEYFHYR